MNLSDLARLVEKAINDDPPIVVKEATGAEYRPYYYLLFLLAQAGIGEPPYNCVELGVEKGRASECMLLGGAKVYGVDHTHHFEVMELEKKYHKDFRFFFASSLPPPNQMPLTIDVLHVDTEHTFAQAREEFLGYKDRLTIPSVVCFDDVKAMNGQVGAYIATLPWPTIFDDRLHECGYGVMLYTGDRE